MPCLLRAAPSNAHRELNMMSPVSIAAMAFSLSVDALLAAIGRGSASTRPDLREALRTGLVFGAIEAITPIFGWAAGIAASRFVESIDPWIAFGLLGLVGGNMILQGFRASHEDGQCGFATQARHKKSPLDARTVDYCGSPPIVPVRVRLTY
jgi:putative Mn2+ efflux pump MntP